jgi:hypothetical protein
MVKVKVLDSNQASLQGEEGELVIGLDLRPL